MIVSDPGDFFVFDTRDKALIFAIKACSSVLTWLAIFFWVWVIAVSLLLEPDLVDCEDNLLCERVNETSWNCSRDGRRSILGHKELHALLNFKRHLCRPSIEGLARLCGKCAESGKRCDFHDKEGRLAWNWKIAMTPILQLSFGYFTYFGLKDELNQEPVDIHEIVNLLSVCKWINAVILLICGYFQVAFVADPLTLPIVHFLDLIGVNGSISQISNLIAFLSLFLFIFIFSFAKRIADLVEAGIRYMYF